jgi:hypothetical protein
LRIAAEYIIGMRRARKTEFAAAPATVPRAEIAAADDTPDLALLRLVRALAVQAAREAFAANPAETDAASSGAVS